MPRIVEGVGRCVRSCPCLSVRERVSKGVDWFHRKNLFPSHIVERVIRQYIAKTQTVSSIPASPPYNSTHFFQITLCWALFYCSTK